MTCKKTDPHKPQVGRRFCDNSSHTAKIGGLKWGVGEGVRVKKKVLFPVPVCVFRITVKCAFYIGVTRVVKKKTDSFARKKPKAKIFTLQDRFSGE